MKNLLYLSLACLLAQPNLWAESRKIPQEQLEIRHAQGETILNSTTALKHLGILIREIQEKELHKKVDAKVEVVTKNKRLVLEGPFCRTFTLKAHLLFKAQNTSYEKPLYNVYATKDKLLSLAQGITNEQTLGIFHQWLEIALLNNQIAEAHKVISNLNEEIQNRTTLACKNKDDEDAAIEKITKFKNETTERLKKLAAEREKIISLA